MHKRGIGGGRYGGRIVGGIEISRLQGKVYLNRR